MYAVIQGELEVVVRTRTETQSSRAGAALAGLALLLAAAAGQEDQIATGKVSLKDGAVLVGEVKVAPEEVTVESSYGTSQVPRAKVRSIEWDPPQVARLDVDTMEVGALRAAADREFEEALRHIQATRGDELVSDLERMLAQGHLDNARRAYEALAETDPGQAGYAQQRLTEVNAQSFWCDRMATLGPGEDPGTVEEASAAAEEAGRAALEQAQAYEQEHPEDAPGIMDAYLDVMTDHRGTAAAQAARQRVLALQDDLARRATEDQEDEPETAGGPLPPPIVPTPEGAVTGATTPEEVQAQSEAELNEEARTDHFLVRAAGKSPEDLAAELEAAWDVAAPALGIRGSSDTPVPVWVFEDSKAFQTWFQARQGLDLNNRIRAEVRRALGGDNASSVMLLADDRLLAGYWDSQLATDLRRNLPEAMLLIHASEAPDWLNRGMGRLLELGRYDPVRKKLTVGDVDTQALDPLRLATRPAAGGWRAALRRVQLFPIQEVINGPPVDMGESEWGGGAALGRQITGGRQELYQAQCWALVHWCLSRGGPGSTLVAYGKGLVKGKSGQEMYQLTFGRANAQDKLDRAFEDYVKKTLAK